MSAHREFAKRRRASPSLSDQQIVTCALALIEREGAAKLSMRKLASKLHATPMALYYYVASKEALIAKIVDSVLSQVPQPPPTRANWRRELKAYAVGGWQRLAQYPGLSTELIKLNSTPQADQLAIYGASILIAAGFDQASVGLAITSYHATLFGVMNLQARFVGKRPRAARANRTPSAYLAQLDFRELIEFAADLVIAGLHEELTRQRAARRSSASSKPALGKEVSA
ncbi:MAG TPA: TetR/AcrR family transcriptional regulator [Polyangiales bacterium]